MNRFKKTVASMTAVVTLLSSMAGMSAMAAERAANYYPAYDTYSTSYVSVNSHYVAALTDYVIPCNLKFYIAPTTITGNYTSTEFFSKGSAFTGITMGTISGELDTDTSYKFTVKLTGTQSLTEPEVVVKYRIPTGTLSSLVSTEYNLHLYTSTNRTSGDTNIATNQSVMDVKKCLYSLGDVDRDGRITSSDTLAVTKYVQGLYEMNSARGDLAAYDKLAFELAADINEDGAVTSDDANLIAQLLMGTARPLNE